MPDADRQKYKQTDRRSLGPTPRIGEMFLKNVLKMESPCGNIEVESVKHR